MRRDTGVFESPVTILQQHSMLRINPTGFLIGDVKERCVEVSNVVEKTALAGVHFARLALGTVKAIHVPAIGRNLTHRINAIHQVLPELVNVVGSREAAAHADDRHVFSNACRLVSRFSGDRCSF